jgi:hypothetical protein
MENVASLKQKMKFLRRKLAKEPNIRIKTDNPEKAFFQASLSRGDRRTGRVLLNMVRNETTWKRAFSMENISAEDYNLRQRGRYETFPWEIIDHKIDRNYLWAEYQKALQGKPTAPCDTSRCKRCGVCIPEKDMKNRAQKDTQMNCKVQ